MAIRDLNFDIGDRLDDSPFLIVGLGNVGAKYEQTRHNAGFMALDTYNEAEQVGGNFKDKTDLEAYVLEGRVQDKKVILAKPTTFMNESGRAVIKLQQYFGVNDPNILIIYDDVDIDFGTVRMRIGGSSGGHNGLKSLERHIGPDFARIRIGVGNEILEHQDTADFVLSNFSKSEDAELDKILNITNEHIAKFITSSFEETSVSL